MRILWQDLRYTFRQLRNAPVWAATAVLTLALGLGATTAMLAIVDSVLVRPVALPHAERVVGLTHSVHGEPAPFLFQDLATLGADGRTFAALAGFKTLPGPIASSAGTRVAEVIKVTPKFSAVAGVPARFGRVFSADEANRPVAVVSYAFWRERLGSDTRVIGSAVKIDGRLMTIVGVLPPRFTFPESIENESVYVPLLLDRKGADENGFNNLQLAGRLRPGIALGTAAAEENAVFGHTASTAPGERGRIGLRSYREVMSGYEQPALLALLGACFLLLGIACVNAANLQIARAAVRTGEMQVRAALGAGRVRLFRQIATESLTVSLLGAGLGLMLALFLLYGVRMAYSSQFGRFDELALSPAVFAACALLAVLAGLLAAVAPATSAARGLGSLAVPQALRATRRSRLALGLVVVEVALTSVLLVTASLFLRTFRALEHAPLGFDPHRVTEVVLMPTDPHASSPALKLTHERLLARLQALPGVEAAATETSLPFSSMNLTVESPIKVAGRPVRKGEIAGISVLSPDFTHTLGLRPAEGRGFLPSDRAGAQPVCLVNQAFRRRYLGGRRAVGATVELTQDDPSGPDERILQTPLTVVGVLPDQISGRSLDEVPEPRLFVPFAQFPADAETAHFMFGISPQFAVRSALPQAELERELRAALKEAAPDMAEMQIGSMEANIAASLTRQRLVLRLASGFGFLALALAAVGIYGVLASSVAQRTREIGIRIALGASRGQAMGQVLRQAAWMASAGLVVGALCAWPAGRAVKAFLYGVAPLDPLSLTLAALVLLLVCAAAALIPASRAARVDPVIALRAE